MKTMDRDALIELIEEHVRDGRMDYTPASELADAILAQQRPAPQQTIDRDALEELIAGAMGYERDTESPAVRVVVNEVLALLRPVDGVTLTREEAAIAIKWYTGDLRDDDSAPEVALVAKLEVAS